MAGVILGIELLSSLSQVLTDPITILTLEADEIYLSAMYRSDRFCTKINYRASSDLVLVALIYCLRIKVYLLNNLCQEFQKICLESSHKEEYQAQALSLDLSVPLLSQSRYPKIKREKYYHWIQLRCRYISISYPKIEGLSTKQIADT